MSGWQRWASAAPSHSVTRAWAIDCGCTTTSIRSYGVPNRWWASISSRPLFISVAESIVILPPIVQVGCLRASSTVTCSRSRRPRNGPPLAVMISLSTTPGGSPVSRWCSAVCSESIGTSCAPVASASAVTSSPPTTSDSLFASATSMPSVSATIVGPRPAEPTIALSTRSAPDSATSCTRPSDPPSTSPPVHASAARAAALRSPSAIRGTPCARACLTSVSGSAPPGSPHRSNRSPARATTSSACVPIDPVEPRMRSRFTRPIVAAAISGITKVASVDIPLRDTGGNGPPVLFLHGLLVDGSIWDPVVERLPGHRCLVPELPLGSHTTPFPDRSRLTPQGVANLAADVLDELGLEDVTLVANDTGGALAQLIVTSRPQRIGRLIPTPWDAFETFPPPLFKLLFVLGRTAFGLNAGIQPLRFSFGRRLPIAYGKLTRRAGDDLLKRWIAPALSESRVRKDTAHFIRHCSKTITLDAAAKLPAFDKPVTIAWPPGDPAFPFSLAERLSRTFPRARLVEVADSLAFVPIDQPDVLARLIQSPQASS